MGEEKKRREGEHEGSEVNVTESTLSCLNICQPHSSSLLGNYLTMSNNKTVHKIAKEVTPPDGGALF